MYAMRDRKYTNSLYEIKRTMFCLFDDYHFLYHIKISLSFLWETEHQKDTYLVCDDQTNGETCLKDSHLLKIL